MSLHDIVPLFEAAKKVLRNGHSNAVRHQWERLPEVRFLSMLDKDWIWQLATVAVASKQ